MVVSSFLGIHRRGEPSSTVADTEVPQNNTHQVVFSKPTLSQTTGNSKSVTEASANELKAMHGRVVSADLTCSETEQYHGQGVLRVLDKDPQGNSKLIIEGVTPTHLWTDWIGEGAIREVG